MAILSTRAEPTLTGHVNEDAGTVSAMTAVTIDVDEYSLPISYNNSTKRISLPANMSFAITVELGQTGSGATFEIYDITNTAVLATSVAGAGRKSLTRVIRNTSAAREIQIRVDDQTANTITATTGTVYIRPLV